MQQLFLDSIYIFRYTIQTVCCCKGNNMDYKIQTVHNAADDMPQCKEIVELTRPVRKTYPEYGKWLEEKFFPGLKDGSRIIIAAKDETGRLAGTILLKKTAEEKKLCCLFVRQDCRGRGIAGKLMQESLEVLQTDKPLLSIAEKNYPQMQKLLSLHHFKFSYRKNGAYTTNGTEYYFNNEATEILKKEVLSPQLARARQRHESLR